MAQASTAGGRLHNILGNRNIVGQHTSESAGVFSPSSINPNDIGKNWFFLGIIDPFGFRSMVYCGNGISLASTIGFPTNPQSITYRSTDYGRSWASLTSLSLVNVNCMEYLGNGVVLACDNSGHIFRSIDYGLTFTDLGAISAAGIIKLKYLGKGIVIFGDGAGFVQRSINFGATWPLAIGVAASPINALTYLDNGIVIAGDNTGKIYRSTNIISGVPTFTQVSTIGTGIRSSEYLSNGIAITGDNNSHIFRSTDFGLTWTDIGNITGVAISIVNFKYLGNGVVILALSVAGGPFIISTDYGATWPVLVSTPGALPANPDTLAYCGNGIILFGDTGGQIFRSDISYKTEETVQDIEKRIISTSVSLGLNYIHSTILVDASANPTISLPSAAGSTTRSLRGHIYNIKKTDGTAGVLTITPAGAEKIDGAPNYTIGVQYQNVMIQSDGSNWWVI